MTLKIAFNFALIVSINLFALFFTVSATPVNTITTSQSSHVTIAPGPAQASSIASSKPSTTCSYVAVSPAPAMKFCDVQGYLHHPAQALSTHSGKTAADCLNHCLAAGSEDCRAFGLDLTIKQCTLYNQSVDSQTFKDGYSNVWYWSRKCFQESCAGTATSAGQQSTTTASPLPTSKVTGTKTAGTASLTASVPVTTITTGGHKCTIPVPLAPRDCKSIKIAVPDSPYEVSYDLYFNGSGVIESSSNPGNTETELQPWTEKLPSSDTACNAATKCAGNAASLGMGAVYLSFDLYYNSTSCNWFCTAYGGYNNNGSFFSVEDSSAYVSHGFSGKMKKKT